MKEPEKEYEWNRYYFEQKRFKELGPLDELTQERLAEIAQGGEAVWIRRELLWRIKDQAVIEYIAKNDPEGLIRWTAAKELAENNRSLAEWVMRNDTDYRVRVGVACYLMTGKGYFGFGNYGEKGLCELIKTTDDATLLRDIVKHEKGPIWPLYQNRWTYWRRLALERLIELKFPGVELAGLPKLKGNDKWRNFRTRLRALKDQKLCAWYAINGEGKALRNAAAECLSDQELLNEALERSKHYRVRKIIANRIIGDQL